MALKFQCENCGEDIAVRFLTVDEVAKCKNCGANNSVPESAEEISEEAAEHLIKAPISESAKRIDNQLTQSLLMTKALRIIGTLSIGFGVIAGIAGGMGILNQHPAPDQTVAWAFSGIITAFGITFYFCSLGVICLGIAKVLELLSK